MEKSRKVFGNSISEKVIRKGEKTKKKHIKKFGDDSKINPIGLI
jgi:hypothetical protein